MLAHAFMASTDFWNSPGWTECVDIGDHREADLGVADADVVGLGLRALCAGADCADAEQGGDDGQDDRHERENRKVPPGSAAYCSRSSNGRYKISRTARRVRIAGRKGSVVSDELRAAAERALQGNLEKEAAKLARQGKLFVRDRLALLLDEGSFVESSLLANALAGDLPADGVVTGIGTVGGRPVCVMANDSTVKAGSWGARTVEKIVRLTEYALEHEVPVFWLVDSAGARLTDQVELFPGRRGAGRIFYNQNRLSGRVPQICCLFGPSAAGGAYIPAFCDVVIMVEGNASMYLGSPRMVEMVVGERTTLEEMGGARMHATVSGSGDNLAVDDADAIAQAKAYFGYMPSSWRSDVPVYAAEAPAVPLTADVVPPDEHVAFDMHDLLARPARRRQLLRGETAVRTRGDRGIRAARGPTGRSRREQPGAQGRCALRRLGRQGGAFHLVL